MLLFKTPWTISKSCGFMILWDVHFNENTYTSNHPFCILSLFEAPGSRKMKSVLAPWLEYHGVAPNPWLATGFPFDRPAMPTGFLSVWAWYQKSYSGLCNRNLGCDWMRQKFWMKSYFVWFFDKMWSENPALSNFIVKNISFRLNKEYHLMFPSILRHGHWWAKVLLRGLWKCRVPLHRRWRIQPGLQLPGPSHISQPNKGVDSEVYMSAISPSLGETTEQQ